MSVPYKKKPNRVKDAVRKMWKAPGYKGRTTLAGTADDPPATDTVPYKGKPPRKGRPDGA
jgi:hypothetical protein